MLCQNNKARIDRSDCTRTANAPAIGQPRCPVPEALAEAEPVTLVTVRGYPRGRTHPGHSIRVKKTIDSFLLPHPTATPTSACWPSSAGMAAPTLACRGFGLPALLLGLAAAVARPSASLARSLRLSAASGSSTSNATVQTSNVSCWPADARVQCRHIPGLLHPAGGQRKLTGRRWETTPLF